MFMKNLMKIPGKNNLLTQAKTVIFIPKNESQKLAQNKRPEQKQFWPQPSKDLGIDLIRFIVIDPIEMCSC